MSNGIKLSEKHGVNPTIPVCYWCGEEKNEIVMLGKLKGDKEAPMRMILDMDPCDECKKAWDDAKDIGAILVFEVTEEPNVTFGDMGYTKEQIENIKALHTEYNITDGSIIYTGAMFAITSEAFDRVIASKINNPDLIKEAHEKQRLLLDYRIFRHLVQMTKEVKEDEDPEGST